MTETPQTTRCPECDKRKPQLGVSLAPEEANSWCDCHTRIPVPAPSAPARAGEPLMRDPMFEEPTLKRTRPLLTLHRSDVEVAVVALDFAIENADEPSNPDAERDHERAMREARGTRDRFNAALRTDSRALAPATAEPTADVIALVERTSRLMNATDLVSISATDLSALQVAALRGSGPVGQASEPTKWEWRWAGAMATGRNKWREIDVGQEAAYQADPDVEVRALYSAPVAVAASAEAKRDAARLDWLVKRLMLVPMSDGTVRLSTGDGYEVPKMTRNDYPTPYTDKHIIAAIDAAMGHASPESGV